MSGAGADWGPRPELVAAAAAGAAAAKVTAQRRDVDGPLVDRALEIVRKFIIDRGLVLFGGLAIDYTLRLRGDHIYPDDERPDFDFLSPRSVDDAYELAEMLRAAGFPRVDCVRAIHVQTTKVRTDFQWVADIGYAPEDVFERLPTVLYEGMRVIHPDFQRMDMHLSWCFPYSGAPREDVFNRWRKDLKRFNLFERHYPLPAPAELLAVQPPSAAVTIATGAAVAAAAAGSLSVAIHGYAAYGLLRAALDEMVAAVAAPGYDVWGESVEAPRLPVEIGGAGATITAPTGVEPRLVLATPAPVAAAAAAAAATNAPVEWYDPYMDITPIRARVGAHLEIYSTCARQLAVSTVQISDGECALVVTPPYLLMWLLFEAHSAASAEAAAIHRGYYRHTLNIIAAAERLAVAHGAAAVAVFAASPFAPSLKVLGEINTDAAYTIRQVKIAASLHEAPPAALGLDPELVSSLSGLPRDWYDAEPDASGRLGAVKPRPVFDYGAAPLFRRSGRRRETAPLE